MRPVAALAATLAFLLGLQPADALDKGAILRIAKKDPSRENLVAELAIFSDGSKFAIDYEVQPVGGNPTRISYSARNKVVEGRFLVSIFRPPGAPNNIYTVVNYDAKAALYRKSIFIPDGKNGTVVEIASVSADGKGTITWGHPSGPDARIESVEKHTAEGLTWSEVHYEKGEIVARAVGTARKTE